MSGRPSSSRTAPARAERSAPTPWRSPNPTATRSCRTAPAQALAPAFFRKLPFDTMNDFIPVTELVSSQSVLVVYPKLPVTNVKELVALAKAKPLNYGVTGLANAANLNMEMFKRAAGVEHPGGALQGRRAAEHRPDRGPDPDRHRSDHDGNPVDRDRPIACPRHPGQTHAPRSCRTCPTAAEALPPGFGMAGWLGWFVAGQDAARSRRAHSRRGAESTERAGDRRRHQGGWATSPSAARRKSSACSSARTSRRFIKVVDEAQIPKLN